jgi:hypothetical protein
MEARLFSFIWIARFIIASILQAGGSGRGRLQEEFDVEAERADKSVLDLVNDLSKQKLVLADIKGS